MSTPQTTATVPQQIESLLEAAVNLGTSFARMGASVIVIPLGVLPEKLRQDAVQVVHNVIDAVGQVNLSAFKAASKASDAWLKEIDTALVKAAKPAEAPPALPAKQ